MSLDPALAARTLRLGVEALDACGVKHWLACGTALGAVRNGDFIGGDTDIDIGIMGQDRRGAVNDELIARGFRLLRFFEDYQACYTLDPAGRECYDGSFLDLFFCAEKDGMLLQRAGALVCYRYSAALFGALRPVRVGGVDAFLPNPPEEYLAVHYGWDWRIKKSEWDWRKDPKCLL